jgi:hypothetical protein
MMNKCIICDASPLSFRWTDAHGVGQCLKCGAPYRLYHFDENEKRIEKPAEIVVKPEYVPVLQAYWNQFHRVMPSGHSFDGSYYQGYELASPDDSEQFHTWMNEHADKMLATLQPT